MSDEHQPAEVENEAAPVASSDSDSAADMKAILVIFTAGSLCVFYISGWSFDL